MKKHWKKLDQLHERLKKYKQSFLGYPCDAEFDYSPLYKFLKFPINNVGDPFEDGLYKMETKKFEREVLAFFSRLFHLKDYWGYVTNGGTEGNLQGLYIARQLHPKATVYFSQDAHYSIKKNVHILNMKFVQVKSQPHGEMDYDDLAKRVKGKKEAIVVVNIGTTMKGAVDDPTKVAKVLEKAKVKHYIHADAALYGMVLPFVSDIKFDFRTKINSMAVSGHKFIGSPIPCGICLIRKKLMKSMQSYVKYIDMHDTTISGSRDAFTPLVFWYRIRTIGLMGFRKQAKHCINIGKYLVKRLNDIGWENVHSNYVTVTFKRPSMRVVEKWELAIQDDIAHVVCMPHDRKKHIDGLIADLKKEL